MSRSLPENSLPDLSLANKSLVNFVEESNISGKSLPSNSLPKLSLADRSLVNFAEESPSVSSPISPVILFPKNGMVDVDLSVTLRWKDGGDNNEDTIPDSYDIFLSTNYNSVNSDLNESDSSFISNTSNTELMVVGLDIGTTYYWKVVAKNSSGSTSSSINRFLSEKLISNIDREDLVYFMRKPLLEPTGCWSDYNEYYKYRRRMWSISGNNSIIRRDEVPDIPSVNDFSDLNC